MDYLNGKLCLEYDDIIAVMGRENYNKGVQRESFVKHGLGGNGRKILVEAESLPIQWRRVAEKLFGDLYQYAASQSIKRLIKPDEEAVHFFSGYDKVELKDKHIERYVRQSEWLNMVKMVLADKNALREQLNMSAAQFMTQVITLHRVDSPINPGLPESDKHMRAKLNKYMEQGYESLIELHKFGNNNARKVSDKIEQLLLGLYCMQDNPYMRGVVNLYNEFMAGKIALIDPTTAELYDPKDFYADGKPYTVTDATVKHYLNKPKNEAIVARRRLSDFEYRMKVKPYHQRKAPVYAFSKITMDDTSSPFKMYNGDRPATYKIFDVASTALVAIAMHQKERPDGALIRQVVKNFLGYIIQRGWRMPHQVEVEHAINTSLRGKMTKQTPENPTGTVLQADILTTGNVFPTVTFCAPRNPQEKSAERFIRMLKYGYQKHREGFQARPFARRDANRMNEDNDKVQYTFQEIELMELEDMMDYNNDLHPDQELYPGKTRWQVLEECQNPNLALPNLKVMMPYVGNRTATSLRRGYIQVQGNSYRLTSIELYDQLENSEMVAYWLPDNDGNIPEIYLYQTDGEFICKAPIVDRYQEAKIEQTDDDMRILGQQRDYVKGFEEMAKTPVLPVAVVRTGRTERGEQRKIETGNGQDMAATDGGKSVVLGTDEVESDSKEGGYRTKKGSKKNWWEDPEEMKRRAHGSI